MCGIAGFLAASSSPIDSRTARVRAMTDVLAYRGPDESDVWCDEQSGVTLGHRRLSIVDLTPTGRQPMHSSSGRYVIVYNGEIYNADDLRPQLIAAGMSLEGHSDTRVILEACELWGVRGALDRLAGMFAFSLWDRKERCLFLVRDRLGIKPLYWAMVGGTLIFASELKALTIFPGFSRVIDRNAVASYLRHGYVPGPHSIYSGTQKLGPGQLLRFREGEISPKIETFWHLDNVIDAGRNAPFNGGDNDAIESLDELLRRVVKQHMISDVPLGAFLSGGIDSSAVVALMQAQSSRPVRTFSIGFSESGYNEAEHAGAVARHLKTNHHEHYVSANDAMNCIPLLPEQYDEPFSDSSQIPTYLVSKIARQDVTVALSGDGGDELFGGYTRYFTADKYRRIASRVPAAVRSAASSTILAISTPAWDSLGKVLPAKWRPAHFGDKLHKLAAVLPQDSDEFYRRLISQWWNPEDLMPRAQEYRGLVWDDKVRDKVPDFVERMQYLDTLTYLPDDILTKVDRASMAVSLESRVPLLDHRVVEFSWRLRHSLKIRNGQGKWILRQVLDRYVPRPLVERPKTGFGIPLGEWLRGPLRDWAETLLSPERIGADGLIDPAPVRRCWDEHLSGRRNWQHPLWTVLMLQAWRERWAA